MRRLFSIVFILSGYVPPKCIEKIDEKYVSNDFCAVEVRKMENQIIFKVKE